MNTFDSLDPQVLPGTRLGTSVRALSKHLNWRVWIGLAVLSLGLTSLHAQTSLPLPPPSDSPMLYDKADRADKLLAAVAALSEFQVKLATN